MIALLKINPKLTRAKYVQKYHTHNAFYNKKILNKIMINDVLWPYKIQL